VKRTTDEEPESDYILLARAIMEPARDRRDQHEQSPDIQSIPGCTLEIDRMRGVIYVHGPQGTTLLRICRLPTPIPLAVEGELGLDITHMHGADWKP
jgi:hypothetical protein